MWQGIEVWGDAQDYSYDYPNTNLFNLNQGILELNKPNTITNAHIGVLLGNRNMEFICSTDSMPYVEAMSGGILKARGNDFINNGIGIKYITKTNSDDFTNNIYSNHFFTQNVLVDAYYQTSMPLAYPNSYNPWAGDLSIKNNQLNPNGKTCIGIDIDHVERFSLVDNDYDNMIYGTRIADARINVYSVDDNNPYTFDNMHTGILIYSTNGVLKPHYIYNYKFTNQSYAAIAMVGNRGDYIHHNTIGNQLGYTQDVHQGIVSVLSSDYHIIENKFYHCYEGILAFSNKQGFIGAGNPYWNGNKFFGCQRGITTRFDNHALHIRCNQHTPDPSNFSYDYNWGNWGIGIPPFYLPPQLANQGFPEYQYLDTRCPAGNRFWNLSHKEILSEDDDYYYYHHNATNNPGLEPFDPNGVIHIIENSNEYWLGQAVSCQPIILPAPGPSHTVLPPLSFNTYPYNQIDSLQTEIQHLSIQKDNLMATLDGGETQLLLEAINTQTPPVFLTSLLLNHSPLSDTTLKTFLSEKTNFPPIFFTLIMMKNLPVSSNVYPYYQQRYATLPTHFKRILSYVEGHPITITPTYYDNMIEGTGNLRITVSNDIIHLLLDSVNNRENDALTVIGHLQTEESQKALMGYYIEQGNMAQYDSIKAVFPLISEENQQLITLYDKIKQVYEQGIMLSEIDSADFWFIDHLARQCPENLAVVAARGYLKRITGEYIMPCFYNTIDLRSITQSNEATKGLTEADNSFNLLGDNYPDPASDKTIIPYHLPEGIKGVLYIIDITGKQIAQYTGLQGENELTVNTSMLSAGSYYYMLAIDGYSIESKQFTIVK